MIPFFIDARDLPDAWFQALDLLLSHGRKWTVEHGSYVGQKRWELDYVTIRIRHPGTRPLVPEMPPGLNIPPPATMEYVEEYLPYLMTDQPPKANEAYTYGQRVAPQMERIIERYRRHGFGSNQECIAVARPEDIELDDPPCLRQIDCRVFPPARCWRCGGTGEIVGAEPETTPWGASEFEQRCVVSTCPTCDGRGTETPQIHFVVYFRSNDLWNGFPANLAAIRLMQEYMAECLEIEAGEIIYSSKGLHIYDHVFDLAKIRTGRQG